MLTSSDRLQSKQRRIDTGMGIGNYHVFNVSFLVLNVKKSTRNRNKRRRTDEKRDK
jgi:hypothetical protein